MIRSALLLILLLAPLARPEAAPVPAAEVAPLLGHLLSDREGQEIGRIVDVLVTPDGTPRAVLADIGGFLGIGARRIAIAWSLLRFRHEDEGWAVSVDATGTAVADAPEYDADSKDIPVLGAP